MYACIRARSQLDTSTYGPFSPSGPWHTGLICAFVEGLKEAGTETRSAGVPGRRPGDQSGEPTRRERSVAGHRMPLLKQQVRDASFWFRQRG